MGQTAMLEPTFLLYSYLDYNNYFIFIHHIFLLLSKNLHPMLHSFKLYSLFDIVLLYVIMYDSLNKNLSVITDFYFDVFPKSIGIFLQYYQGGYSASALEAGQI